MELTGLLIPSLPLRVLTRFTFADFCSKATLRLKTSRPERGEAVNAKAVALPD